MTPEGKVKLAVKRLLAGHKTYTFWPVQHGYGARTLDCLGMCNSYGFAIETKRPGEKITPLQQHTAEIIAESGGAPVFVIGTVEFRETDGRISYSGMEELESWLTTVQQK